MNGVLFLFIELLKENIFINITSHLLFDCTCFVGGFLFLEHFYVFYIIISLCVIHYGYVVII